MGSMQKKFDYFQKKIMVNPQCLNEIVSRSRELRTCIINLFSQIQNDGFGNSAMMANSRQGQFTGFFLLPFYGLFGSIEMRCF